MLEVSVTTMGKAKALINKERTKNRKARKKSPIIAEYENYLLKLERGKAITITLKEGDIYQTIKYRFNKSAQNLGIKNLKIERAGNKVICYKEVKTRLFNFVQDSLLSESVYEVPTEEQPLYGVEDEAEHEPEYDTEFVVDDEAAPEPVDEIPLPDDSSPTLQTASVNDTEELMEFDFDEEWEVPMIYGHKTCETTTRRYEGTTFDAFEHQFAITRVEQMTLGQVQQKWFKQHGLFSPREFQEVWKQRHNGAFDPEQKVWLHQFQRGFVEPAELPAFGEIDEGAE